jgi:hypothetical protein
VDRARKVHRKLGAETLFDKHVLPLLDHALDENIVTASEAERPKEKENYRLALIILYHHVKEKYLPWDVARQINEGMDDYKALHGLDIDPERDWAKYADIIRKPDGTLGPLGILARLTEKAQYHETSSNDFYGLNSDCVGIRMPLDWESEREIMAEPDMIVYRKLANLFGYRKTYNQIGERVLESINDPEVQEGLEYVRREKKRLSQAIKRTQKAMQKLIDRLCEKMTEAGIPFTVEQREEKGDASCYLKLPIYWTVENINDLVGVKIKIQKTQGMKTENIGGVRTAETLLTEIASEMRENGELPYIEVNPKYYTLNPKPNLYRADHFNYRFVEEGDKNPSFVNGEVMILTQEMADFNDHGGAAHIIYKDGKEYERESGMEALRSTLLGNVDSLRDDLESMQGKPNGSRYQPYPKRVVKPVQSTLTINLVRLDGTEEKLDVPYSEGDMALDVLARSGLDLRTHAVNGGMRFDTEVEQADVIRIVEKVESINPKMAKYIYNSKIPYKRYTRDRLAALFQNGNGKNKSNRAKKAAKKASRKKLRGRDHL